MRAYMTTIGAIDGNIIAAIITTQAVSQKPSAAETCARAGVHSGHPVSGHCPGDGREKRAARDEAELYRARQRGYPAECR